MVFMTIVTRQVGFLIRLIFKTSMVFFISSMSANAVVESNVSAQAVEAAFVSDSSVKTNRIIVKYVNSSSSSLTASALPSSALSHISQVTGTKAVPLRRLSTGAHVIKVDKQLSAQELSQLLSEMAADPNIEYVEEDRMLQAMAIPSDSRYSEQWHYYETNGGLNLPTAWDTTSGVGVVVGVIDTGYRPHADLVANILAGYDMISDTDVAQDGNGRDSDARDPGDWAPAGACGFGRPETTSSWHGTHVAGTVAAVAENGIGGVGVAYGAKVVPIRALGRCGGSISDIADSIIWGAGGNVPGVSANANPAQVLNLSLGGAGSCSATMQAAINSAVSLGATVVVAAGNSNANAANATPANCNNVVTVASVGRDGGRAFYSNFGSVVDLAAPGGETNGSSANGVLSTLNTGSRSPGADNYAFYQGTSMAAPHVAGLAALMYAVNSELTPAEVESILKNTARDFPASCSQCGSGIADASAAVAAANNGDPNPDPDPDPDTPAELELENGVPVAGLFGAQAEQLVYTLQVPTGATSLTFTISGGSGDADLYVRFGAEPTTASYDCRPYITGNNETCNVSDIRAGTYYVMLRGYRAFTGVSLLGTYTEESEPDDPDGDSITEIVSGSRGEWKHFSLIVPEGASALTASISGGSGDADLYVRFGAEPTTFLFDCRPYVNGNAENCNIDNPQAGRWYVSLRGYRAFGNVELEASTN